MRTAGVSATRQGADIAPEADRNVVRISVGSVDDLARLSRPLLKPVAVTVDLHIANLDEPRLREIERNLSRNLSACGCGEGAALGLLYLVALLAVLIAGGGPSSPLQWSLALVGLCIATAVGKLAGIGVARMRLSREIRAVTRLIGIQTGEGGAKK
jgi:hypothetical protein